MSSIESSVHNWIKNISGKATVCSKCGSMKNVQWSNKDHQYKRIIDDWQQLCLICHADYDSKLRKQQLNTKLKNGEEVHLSENQVAKILNKSNKWVHRRILNNEIKAIRYPGGFYRILSTELKRLNIDPF